MTQNTDLCPLNTTGDHRYFIFKTVEVFEPIETGAVTHEYGQLYQKLEFGLLGCNCGSVIKSKVKQQ